MPLVVMVKKVVKQQVSSDIPAVMQTTPEFMHLMPGHFIQTDFYL